MNMIAEMRPGNKTEDSVKKLTAKNEVKPGNISPAQTRGTGEMRKRPVMGGHADSRDSFPLGMNRFPEAAIIIFPHGLRLRLGEGRQLRCPDAVINPGSPAGPGNATETAGCIRNRRMAMTPTFFQSLRKQLIQGLEPEHIEDHLHGGDGFEPPPSPSWLRRRALSMPPH